MGCLVYVINVVIKWQRVVRGYCQALYCSYNRNSCVGDCHSVSLWFSARKFNTTKFHPVQSQLTERKLPTVYKRCLLHSQQPAVMCLTSCLCCCCLHCWMKLITSRHRILPVGHITCLAVTDNCMIPLKHAP